ncbi:MAG TPA: hypothetical protein VM290_01050 [Gaiellaceae bacterium]|nr:hypothetical protein [Gaiellaceae bacterium]
MYALSRILAAAACLVSGGIHLALVPGHTAGTPALAALFAAAGTALSLLGLALALDVGTRQVVRAASGTLAAVLVAYAVDRTVGLPLADAAEHAHGHAAGGADTLPIATKGIEALGLVAALACARVSGARIGFRPVRG